jgi:hypothetical protein
LALYPCSGAVVGAERSKGDVSTLIKDALAGGQFVLVAHAATEVQTSQAQRILGESMATGEGSPSIGASNQDSGGDRPTLNR